MSYNILYLFVEGTDDERFFESVIKPKFEGKYDYVEMMKYAHKSTKYIFNFLKTIKSMNNSYIYFSDINDTPCITLKKQEILETYKNIDKDRIVIVIKEIESWYLAGLNEKDSKKLTKRSFKSTDTITKEQFNTFRPKNESRINFMIELLNVFSRDTAIQKNNSFSYFMKKHCN